MTEAAADGALGARAVLAELELVLVQERRAIATLDSPTIQRLAATKLEVAHRLKEFDLTAPRGNDAASRELRSLARRVHQLAVANKILLDDAHTTMAEVLGVPVKPMTYDRHARGNRGRLAASLVAARSA